MAGEERDEAPVAESPKAEKKQAGREKLIVGGTLALVVLTYMIYRRSQTKQTTAAQGYPLGYGGGSGGGGSLPSFPGAGVDPSSPALPTPAPAPASGTQPANQTPGPGTGPTQPVVSLPIIGSLNNQSVYTTPQGFMGQYDFAGPGGASLVDLVNPATGLASITGLSPAEAAKYSGYTVVAHGSTPVPVGELAPGQSVH